MNFKAPLTGVSPELLASARDETAKTVAGLMLTLLGFGFICFLTLNSPDRLLIQGRETVNVPFAGSVAFSVFLATGPALLLGLRLYLHIYLRHLRRLDAALESGHHPVAPVISPLHHPVLRWVSAFILYLLPPIVLSQFAYKGMALTGWGRPLFALFATGTVVHAVIWGLEFRGWRRWLLPLPVMLALAAVALVYAQWKEDAPQLHRRLNLDREDLSGAWLVERDLRGVRLWGANLQKAGLIKATLAEARLGLANLSGADLEEANLDDANLQDARLQGATLRGAWLKKAFLNYADLSGANVEQARMQTASCYHVNFSKATLAWAVLEDTTLTNSDFTEANLSNARFDGADLAGAKLDQADLSGADLRGARNLKADQLANAFGDERTLLPDSLRGVRLKRKPRS